jgi:hypothetical protein
MNKSPAALMLDGPTPYYDHAHRAQVGSQMRVAFTVTTALEVGLVAGRIASINNDNNDEGDWGILANGVAWGYLNSAPADGSINSTAIVNGVSPVTFQNKLLALTPPYHIEIVAPNKINYDPAWTFESSSALVAISIPSAATIDTNTTTSRLVILSAGWDYGGQSANLLGQSPASGSAGQQMRADFPGRITLSEMGAAQSAHNLFKWGNGSMLPHADYVSQLAVQGGASGANVTFLYDLGIADWWYNYSTAAVFATRIAAHLDRVHANLPSAIIQIAKPIQTASYASNNARPETLQAFADAIGALTGGRGWLLLRDMTTPGSIAFSGVGNLFPTAAAGAGTLKANTKTRLPY